MGLLALDNLAQGMILKSDVFDRCGRLILGCGVELKAKHLRMFRMWGIAEVDIVGTDDQAEAKFPDEDIDPEKMSLALKEMRHIFRNTDLSNPVMGELFRLCLFRKVRDESC